MKEFGDSYKVDSLLKAKVKGLEDAWHASMFGEAHALSHFLTLSLHLVQGDAYPFDSTRQDV